MGLLRAAIKAQAAAKPDDEAGCGQIILERLDQDGAAIAKRIYPTAKGLAFRIVDFPRAVENVCLGDDGSPNPIVVPYAELKPFLKANQRLLPASGPPSPK